MVHLESVLVVLTTTDKASTKRRQSARSWASLLISYQDSSLSPLFLSPSSFSICMCVVGYLDSLCLMVAMMYSSQTH